MDNIFNTFQFRFEPLFLTEEQIVEDVLSKLNAEDRLKLRSIPFEELIGFHSNFGQQIRNKYKLWDVSNPYTHHVDDHPDHPDNLSFRIIQTVWLRIIPY